MKKSILIITMFLTILIVSVSCGKKNESYSVFFINDEVTTTISVIKNNNINTTQIPSTIKEGYTFLGWFIDDELVDLSTYVVTKDVTINAKYQVIIQPIFVNVTFINDGSEKTISIPIGSLIPENEIPSTEKEGYNFLGWFVDEKLVVLNVYLITTNVTLVAKYELIVIYHTVTFDYDNNTLTLNVEDNHTINSSLVPSTEVDGYNFLGWFVEDTLINIDTYQVVSDIVVIAKYELIVIYHTVTFDYDNNILTLSVEDNHTIDSSLVPSTEVDGYNFLGWFVEDTLINIDTYQVVSDIVVIAKYEEKIIGESETILYAHTFISNDIKLSGGSSTLNGLTWSYNTLSFLGAYTYGIQIGSKNNPQKEILTFQTNLVPGTKVLSYTIYLCTASGGDSTYTVEFGDYSTSHVFNNVNDPYAYGSDELNVSAETFSFSLVSRARAIYLQRIEILLSLPANHGLNIINEDNVEVGPVEINIPPIYNVDTLDLDSYYFNANSKTGNELLLALRDIITVMTKRSYADAKTILLYADESVEFPGYLYGLYDGDKIPARWDSGASWNREHVWACAQMQITSQARPDEDTKNHTSDLHNLRVACGPSNGNHGNLFFDDFDVSGLTITPNVTNLNGKHLYNNDHRGDIARILFYMFTRYEGLELNDDLDTSNNVSMGKLSSLLRWNIEDPVDDFEIQRNNRIYEYQGNRNPYIDNPELINLIFDYTYTPLNSNNTIYLFQIQYFIVKNFKYEF